MRHLLNTVGVFLINNVRKRIRTLDLLIRSQALYPAELCTQKTIKKYARNRNRTGTGVKSRRILSPVRLPVPPLGHIMVAIGFEPMTLCL